MADTPDTPQTISRSALQNSDLEKKLDVFIYFHEDFDVLRSAFAPKLDSDCRPFFDAIGGQHDLRIAFLRSDLERLLDDSLQGLPFERGKAEEKFKLSVELWEDVKARLAHMIKKTRRLRKRMERGCGKNYVVDTPRYKIIGNNDRATYYTEPAHKLRTKWSAKYITYSQATEPSKASSSTTLHPKSKQPSDKSIYSDPLHDLQVALCAERIALQEEKKRGAEAKAQLEAVKAQLEAFKAELKLSKAELSQRNARASVISERSEVLKPKTKNKIRTNSNGFSGDAVPSSQLNPSRLIRSKATSSSSSQPKPPKLILTNEGTSSSQPNPPKLILTHRGSSSSQPHPHPPKLVLNIKSTCSSQPIPTNSKPTSSPNAPSKIFSRERRKARKLSNDLYIDDGGLKTSDEDYVPDIDDGDDDNDDDNIPDIDTDSELSNNAPGSSPLTRGKLVELEKDG